MKGLTIKNGRLINNRPVGMTGIQEVAKSRAMRKRIDKINMIADGVDLAESRKEIRKFML